MAVATRRNPVTARLTRKNNFLAGRSVWYLAFAAGLVGLALYFLAGSHPLSGMISQANLLFTAFLLFLCPVFTAPCVTLWMTHETRSEQYQLLYLSEMSDIRLVGGYVRGIFNKCRVFFLISIILIPSLLLLWVQANRLIVEVTVPLRRPCTLVESACPPASTQNPYHVAEVNRVVMTQFPEWILVFSTIVNSQIGMFLAAIVMGVAVALKSRGSTKAIISTLVTGAAMICLLIVMGGLLLSVRAIDQDAIQMVIRGNPYPSHVGQILLLSALSALFPFVVAFAMFGLAKRWARQPSNS